MPFKLKNRRLSIVLVFCLVIFLKISGRARQNAGSCAEGCACTAVQTCAMCTCHNLVVQVGPGALGSDCMQLLPGCSQLLGGFQGTQPC